MNSNRKLPARSAGLTSAIRLISATQWLREHEIFGVGVAFIASAAAALIRHALDPYLPSGYPFLTFFPVVILTAFFCGLKPGIFAAVMSGLLAWYYFIPPFGQFRIDVPNAIALGFYSFIVLVDIVLIHFMHRASSRLTEEEAETRALHEEQRVMFQELQHRVANNIQFIASLLNLQKRRVNASDPGATVAALEDARVRLESMSRIHRRLYDPQRANVPLKMHVEELAADLLHATSARNIDIRVEMSPITLDLTRLTTLSLLIAEVVTNSLKHAFSDQGGKIIIALKPIADGQLRLTIADNGRGFPKDFDPAKSSGLGWRIVKGLVQQLQGTLSFDNNDGTAVMIAFPATPGQPPAA